LLFGYGLLGAGWLILKTEGDVQTAARRHGRICLLGVVLAIGIVSIWTPFMTESIAARWFAWPNIALLAPVPLATAAVAWLTWRARSATMRKSRPSSARSASSFSRTSASPSASIR